ncbi:hypothetical protein, partial [Peribacillus frigoritolerans]|uniref:hypothetical protein n=1 Tax=Peribacillus frigoritolerans TaxID=450367 RepID=UPI00399F2ECD
RKISHKKHPVNVSLVSNIYGAVQLDFHRICLQSERRRLPPLFTYSLLYYIPSQMIAIIADYIPFSLYIKKA